MANAITSNAPLKDMDEWDEFLTGRYQEGKSEDQFRQYDETATRELRSSIGSIINIRHMTM